MSDYVLICDMSDYVLICNISNYVLICDMSDYVLICDMLDYVLICDMSDYVLISDMSSYALLKDAIDKKHRAALMEAGKNLDVLIPRTPKSNWMIHPQWVDRYVCISCFNL
jgi:hypothetical protein